MPKAPARPYDARDAGLAGGLLGSAVDLFRRRPVDTLAGLAAAAGVATILVNALALQEGRHPAPLFQDGAANPATRAAPSAAATPQRSELVAQIQDGLVARGLYDGAVDGLMGARTSTAILAFEQTARLPTTGQASERVMAALLIAPARKDTAVPLPATPWRAAPTPPAKAPATAPATTGSVSAPKLMAVQRALGKLGYGPVTIDGKMGAATRNALLSFERDRKLPQTGEPGTQVLRELQAVSGAPLE